MIELGTPLDNPFKYKKKKKKTIYERGMYTEMKDY